jgi:very-short-patch-repair endonuclease
VAPRPRVPLELRRRPFTLDEARAAGLSAEGLRSRCWRRLGRGLYCWTKLEVKPWQLLAAWRELLPPDFAFAGFSAAWLHRLDVDPCHPIEVVVPPNSWARSRAGLVVRHGSFETTTTRGLPATTVERTFRDLRRRLPPVEILVLADQALRLRLGRFDELAEPAESPMETRLRWTLLQAGLPRPQVQTELRDSEGRFLGRADLYYPQSRLVIEYDGANHRDRLVEDDRRQNTLLTAGFRLLRFTAADQPEVVTALVGRALV